jgi:hypothetical protein
MNEVMYLKDLSTTKLTYVSKREIKPQPAWLQIYFNICYYIMTFCIVSEHKHKKGQCYERNVKNYDIVSVFFDKNCLIC